MQHRSMRRRGFGLLVGLCAVSISAALGVQAAGAQQTRSANSAATAKPQPRGTYYVDFRARTAASYGHAFVWFGRTDQRAVDVAGLHPATDSVVPYILGHVIPVPSETGASYGDLDEEYVTASYRVHMNEADGKRVHALHQAPAGQLSRVERRHLQLRVVHPGHRQVHGLASSQQSPPVSGGLGQQPQAPQPRTARHAPSAGGAQAFAGGRSQSPYLTRRRLSGHHSFSVWA